MLKTSTAMVATASPLAVSAKVPASALSLISQWRTWLAKAVGVSLRSRYPMDRHICTLDYIVYAYSHCVCCRPTLLDPPATSEISMQAMLNVSWRNITTHEDFQVLIVFLHLYSHWCQNPYLDWHPLPMRLRGNHFWRRMRGLSRSFQDGDQQHCIRRFYWNHHWILR